jgi:hypothetical protein
LAEAGKCVVQEGRGAAVTAEVNTEEGIVVVLAEIARLVVAQGRDGVGGCVGAVLRRRCRVAVRLGGLVRRQMVGIDGRGGVDGSLASRRRSRVAAAGHLVVMK